MGWRWAGESKTANDADAAMQAQQFAAMQKFAAMQQCNSSNAGAAIFRDAAMHMQQCNRSNAGAAISAVQQCRCGNAGAATNAAAQQLGQGVTDGKVHPTDGKVQTPPMEKFRPHRWKSSDPTDGKGQTPPMEKFTAAAQLPAHD
jgi:hypothetical protein